MGDLEVLDEHLKRLGYDTSARKSLFQQNEELASVLLTFMMAEIDVLNMRVAQLEVKLNAE